MRVVSCNTFGPALELTGDGTGVDIVYDPIGGAQGEQALRALREDGQFLVIGFASGMLAAIVTAISDGRLSPVEPIAYPLEQAAPALQDQFDRKIVGKTVLVP